MSASATVFSNKTKKYVSSVEIAGEREKNMKPCALTIYFCNSGENLWNIAKHYSTTVDAIMAENSIEKDVFENGKINAYSDKKIVASYSVDDFSRRPGAVFRKLHSQVITSNNS